MSSKEVSTVFCIRWVSLSIGFWKPGRSTSTSCQSSSFATPKIAAARRVRHRGRDRDLLADERVDERRLADVRPPGDGDEAGLHGSGKSQVSGRRPFGVVRRDRAVVAAEAHLRDPELGQPLAAAAAGRGADPDRRDPARAVARDDRRDERALLGADAEWIGGVLDVDALELAAVVRPHDRADVVVRVRRVGARGDRLRLLDAVLGHCATWKTASATSAPSRPP